MPNIFEENFNLRVIPINAGQGMFISAVPRSTKGLSINPKRKAAGPFDPTAFIPRPPRICGFRQPARRIRCAI
jgi:hypothetical protein